jgi:hypothetical protein
MKSSDKKLDDKEKKEEKAKVKTPAEIKKVIEKNRFGGYYKTKVRFIN